MAGKEMKSRERALKALNHQEPDRFPRDLGGTPYTSIHVDGHANLRRYLGLNGGKENVFVFLSQSAVVDPRIKDRLGIDFVALPMNPPSAWELNIETDDQGYKKYTDEWGVVRACPSGGFYYDIISHPLAGATLKDLDRYPWPDPLDPGRFAGLAKRGKALYEGTDKCIVLAAEVSLFAPTAALLGWEEFFRSLVGNQPLIKGFVEQRLLFNEKLISAALDQVGKYVQVVVMSDDLTHQNGLFVRKQVIEDIFMPAYKKLIQLIKSKGEIKVLFHICGASHLMFEDLIAAGVDAVNPVQVSAQGMDDTAALKEKYGARLTFWGGACDTQQVLPFGTPEEVRKEARRRIVDLAPGGGFVFAAVHNIQRDVSPENIMALYDEAIKWERYPIKTEDLRKNL
jgi:uroporphyrinogen decarboxylase